MFGRVGFFHHKREIEKKRKAEKKRGVLLLFLVRMDFPYGAAKIEEEEEEETAEIEALACRC